ncbi:hypothetical protein BCR35DRAFT_332416 [Leucosporidium creatinivorum]|uniref:BZIP domain-containing protein n=1 Tax=Leucosporidium creatinivorum TaxID=106004 RepID=A0A1Y2F519_9BASI|nr:hypothetical protein BCR35DRAFT_332416 [Leucosporidium creatinivorum]
MVTSHPGSPTFFKLASTEASIGGPFLPPFPFPPTGSFTPSYNNTSDILYLSSMSSDVTSAPSTPPFASEAIAETSSFFPAPSSSSHLQNTSTPPLHKPKRKSSAYTKHTKAPARVPSSSLSTVASSQLDSVAESSIGLTEEARREQLRERNRLSKRAQRQRQVDQLEALVVRAEQQEAELAELRAELKSKDQVISMLWERLNASGKL